MRKKFLTMAAACCLLLVMYAPAASAALRTKAVPMKFSRSGESPDTEIVQNTADSALILAVGKDGAMGYVRAADLEGPEINTPEEALAYQREKPDRREIPLYKEDGMTVIGTFECGDGHEVKRIPAKDTDIDIEHGIAGSGLIRAENEYGVVGYVRTADINRHAETLEEALSWDNSPRRINMYLADGCTVIGTFQIGGGYSYIRNPAIDAAD